jgi:hypothetical protein
MKKIRKSKYEINKIIKSPIENFQLGFYFFNWQATKTQRIGF